MDKLGIGDKLPVQVNVLIEIPKGSSVKYELDKDSGVVFVDRFLYTAMYYPFNYGFIPGTLAKDGDPVDMLVLSDHTVMPGMVIPTRPIGMLEMEDEAGIDAKLIGVPPAKIDPLFGAYEDLDDVPSALKDKIRHFFENYKTLEPNKWVKVKDWKGKDAALDEIMSSVKNKKSK